MPAGTDVVLVHGLWHQPAHFDRLAEALRARGMTVHAPSLHRGSLAADTSAVQDVVDSCPEPPLVLGHSYGGSVITGLDRVKHLMFVAAFVPADGESGAVLGGEGALINDIVAVNDDGTTSLDPQRAPEFLFNDCCPDDAQWATSLLLPQRPGHGRGVPRRIGWRDTPSTYIICRRDKALSPVLQERMAARCTTSSSLDAGHSPFLSRPGDLAEAIVRVMAAG